MGFRDPILPVLQTPSAEFLKQNPVMFGKYAAEMTPHQWELTFAPEQFPAIKGSVRSGKTYAAIYRALRHTLWIPGNRGLIGRQFHSDLKDTAQRDFMDIADATGLVKYKNDRNVVMYCVDPATNDLDPMRRTSEVLFRHLDKPNHLKSLGLGWFWIEEASEVRPQAFYRLMDRLTHPPAKGRTSGWITTNPEGRNWIWRHWYSIEDLQSLSDEARKQRRGITNITRDNPHITAEYIQTLINNAPAEWVKRYIDGDDDVFEGQIFKEFDPELHVLKGEVLEKCGGFERGEPPKEWSRYLGIDVGGSNPWAFEFAAVDAWGNVVFYDEVWGPEVRVGNFKSRLAPRFKDRKFAKQVIDYENLTAKDEINNLGISGLRVTNAKKRNKIDALNKMARYLHPNPTRPFPEWHPRKGEMGSPAIFFTSKVKHLADEIPQQKWRQSLETTSGSGELDPTVPHDSVDSSLYLLRERPEPIELLPPPSFTASLELSPTSMLFYINRAEEEKKQRGRNRKWYGPVGLPNTRRIRVPA